MTKLDAFELLEKLKEGNYLLIDPSISVRNSYSGPVELLGKTLARIVQVSTNLERRELLISVKATLKDFRVIEIDSSYWENEYTTELIKIIDSTNVDEIKTIKLLYG